DHGVTAICDQPQGLDDTEHDVWNDRGAADLQIVPLPTLRSEFTDRFGERGSVRISGVTVVDGRTEGVGHRWRQLDIHLRDPQRQHIGRVRAPLHARAEPQLLQCEFFEWIKRHSGRLSGDGRVLTHPVTNACLGIVNGKSTELSSPGSAATTYGTAFTTRI